jgi:hypothetical protein
LPHLTIKSPNARTTTSQWWAEHCNEFAQRPPGKGEKTMQKNILGALVLGSSLAVFAGGVSAADMLTLQQTATNFSGGPFQVSNVSGGDLAGQNFITFCVEIEEHVNAGATQYQYALSNQVKSRGTTGGAYNLNNQTAFLYSSYRSGALNGISVSSGTSNYTFNAASTDHLEALQKAIWDIEYTGTVGGINTTTGLNTLENALYLYATNGSNSWSDLGDVRVLNLTTANGSPAQDQLAVVPIPAAAWLFGSALLGFAGISRKRKIS